MSKCFKSVSTKALRLCANQSHISTRRYYIFGGIIYIIFRYFFKIQVVPHLAALSEPYSGLLMMHEDHTDLFNKMPTFILLTFKFCSVVRTVFTLLQRSLLKWAGCRLERHLSLCSHAS